MTATGSRLWLGAGAVAALGAWIMFDAMPGINYGLWTIAASAGLMLAARHRYAGAEPGTLRSLWLVLGLACLLACGAAITTAEPSIALLVLGVMILMAFGMLLARDPRPAQMTMPWMLTAPPRAALGAVAESAGRAMEAISAVGGERSRPWIRGAIITVPVVVIFGLLLSAADPVFAAWRTGLGDFIDRLGDSVARIIFFAALLVATLGAYGSTLRAEAPAEIRLDPRRFTALRLGSTERLVLLGAVTALFASFLILQLAYLFGNVAAVSGSGITFAEYARRGFGEITIVATLCIVLLVAVERLAERGSREAAVRALELVLTTELQLLLVSAFHRVLLYENAYGYTAARLDAQAYMIVAGAVLILLDAEIWRGLDAARLTRRAAAMGAVALAVLVYWNTDAWIARKNIERYASTGKVDLTYLVSELSKDAVPAVLGAMPRLKAPERAIAAELLAKRYGAMRAQECSWYEWNWRGREAASALVRAGVVKGSGEAEGWGCWEVGRVRK